MRQLLWFQPFRDIVASDGVAWHYWPALQVTSDPWRLQALYSAMTLEQDPSWSVLRGRAKGRGRKGVLRWRRRATCNQGLSRLAQFAEPVEALCLEVLVATTRTLW